MKIYTRKIIQEKHIWENPVTKEKEEYFVDVENGYVEEQEVDLKEITAFSLDKQVRLIGIEKKGLFPLTLTSWKQVKNELTKQGLLRKFDFSKAS